MTGRGHAYLVVLATSLCLLAAACMKKMDEKKERKDPAPKVVVREPAPKPAEPPNPDEPKPAEALKPPPGPAERPLKAPPVPLQIRTPPPAAPAARASARCPRWRYKLLPLRQLKRMDDSAVEKLLNQLGDDGWALARPAILLERALLLSKCAPRKKGAKVEARAKSKIPRGPCRVRLKSTPSRASVMIAGQSKRIGLTPLSLRLGKGEHKTIRVTKVGFRQMVVTLDCAQRRRHLLLKPFNPGIKLSQ